MASPDHVSTRPADAGVLDAARALRSGELSSTALVADCLRRIDECHGEPSLDGSPSAVNAFIRVYRERALEHAERVDAQRGDADARSVLAGIPFGLKDLYAVRGLPLTASSRVLEGNVATETAAVWQHLERQDAVLLGHTHTHEFAAGGTTDQVGNPWSLRHTAGGSSGGSAAAVAAGMVPAALGTDTAGSVRIPASICGVVGIKPTLGRVPVDGVLPLGYSLDHGGPLTRTVADGAAVLNIMAAARRPTTPWTPVPSPGQVPTEAPGGARPLAGVRVAVTDRGLFSVRDAEAVEGRDQAVAALRELGATVVDVEPAMAAPDGVYDTILVSEARAAHQRFAEREQLYRASTREFLDFAADPLPAGPYLQAQRVRADVTASWSQWFDEHRVDVLVEPTLAAVAPLRGGGYDPQQAVGADDPMTVFTALWNLTGFPVVTLPTHHGGSGLPVSVSLVADRWREERAVTVALALQAYAFPPLGIAPVSPVALEGQSR